MTYATSGPLVLFVPSNFTWFCRFESEGICVYIVFLNYLNTMPYQYICWSYYPMLIMLSLHGTIYYNIDDENERFKSSSWSYYGYNTTPFRGEI
jgi:hypothetical protein